MSISRSEAVRRSWAARRAKHGPSGFPPGAIKGWKYSDEEYDRRWIARVLANCVRSPTGCLEWQGWLHPTRGYAASSYRSKNCPVHRQMYQVVHKVKLGRWDFVCHSCDNRICCNVEHLWVGTPKENQQDMSRKGRAGYQSATHCKRGHEFTPENTYRAPSTGRRRCLACAAINHQHEHYVRWRREYQRKRRALKRMQREAQANG